jgi:hypothetical protein
VRLESASFSNGYFRDLTGQEVGARPAIADHCKVVRVGSDHRDGLDNKGSVSGVLQAGESPAP